MTKEEFINKKWRIGQKVYVIYVDAYKSKKRHYFMRQDTVICIHLVITNEGVKTDIINTQCSDKMLFSRGGFYTRDVFCSECNHHEFIFTNKKEAQKALMVFKKKYEDGL